jgi:hypothetical protein
MSPAVSSAPKKLGQRGVHASKMEKAKADAKRKRERRQARSAARRNLEFDKFYAIKTVANSNSSLP